MATPVYVIDTHSLVWYFTESRALSKAAINAFEEIERGGATGVVPTIVLAEIMHLADNKRIPLDADETIARLKQVGYGIVPLDLTVIELMIPLRGYEIHDRVVVATAKSFEASLITKDEHIQKSGAVPCIW